MTGRSYSPIFLVISIVLALGFLLWAPCASPRGGAGIGITCEGDSVGAEGTQTGLDFAYRFTNIPRIDGDLELLVSSTFGGNGCPLSDNEIQGFAFNIDSIVSNEYGFPEHDFGLIYNYFATADHAYGALEWSPYNAMFFRGNEVRHCSRG